MGAVSIDLPARLVVKRHALAVIVMIVAALWYLRDPAWVIDQTTGLRPWQRESDGRLVRWSGGHASFFVPADAGEVRIPISTTFDWREPDGGQPMVVTFTIDGTKAARVLLTDPGWRDVTLTLPRPGSRRVRRVEVRTSVTRADNHGVRIGQPCCYLSR
jgi:hypothetical protein